MSKCQENMLRRDIAKRTLNTYQPNHAMEGKKKIKENNIKRYERR